MKGKEELGSERPREFSASPISMGYRVPLKTTPFSGARVLDTDRPSLQLLGSCLMNSKAEIRRPEKVSYREKFVMDS